MIPFVSRSSRYTSTPIVGQLQTRPPWKFYRAQHDGSLTDFNSDGFFAQACYLMAPCYWLNIQMLNRHLDWSGRSVEPTPFISVFDNQEDAMRRAQLFWEQGKTGVFVAQIGTSTLRPDVISIKFSDMTINLPV